MVEENFPLERILTVSALDYAESVGKRLSNYTLKGIHSISGEGPSELENSLRIFSARVPQEAEVVVDYRNSTSAGGSGWIYFTLSGTALIPRIADDDFGLD